MFMGDAGALLIGLLMATSAISVTGTINPETLQTLGKSSLVPAFIPIILPFAVLVIPLLDFSLAVIRRLRAGKSPFSADRKHLHHRLLDMGHTHLHAVLIFYAWTAVLSIGCLLFFFDPYWMAIVFVAVGLVVCTAVTLAPLSRRKANEAAAELAPAGTKEAVETARYDSLDAASEGHRSAAEPVPASTPAPAHTEENR
jgi:UDP-GlcNAc:undecaprenyl-phosphate GlcNAc-1-phosphate transferase